MGERAIWNGVITFGLVTMPVSLHAATHSESISFKQIHKKCQTHIEEKRWCPKCEKYIAWDEIEKGFEYTKGKFVVVTKDDLDSLPLPSKNVIVIQSFVKLEEIDPIYFDKSYYLQTEENVSRPFNLFIRALADKQMVAIGSFAIRSRERFCCLRPVGNTLIAETLLYPDEINIDLKAKLTKIKVAPQEMAMVAKLIDMMAEPFDPEQFKDHYRETLQKVIEAKIGGHEITKPVKAEKGQLLDLMTALKRSVERAEGSKGDKSAHARKPRRQHKAG